MRTSDGKKKKTPNKTIKGATPKCLLTRVRQRVQKSRIFRSCTKTCRLTQACVGAINSKWHFHASSKRTCDSACQNALVPFLKNCASTFFCTFHVHREGHWNKGWNVRSLGDARWVSFIHKAPLWIIDRACQKAWYRSIIFKKSRRHLFCAFYIHR